MGSRIIHMIHETPSILLYRAVERPDHPSIGKDIGEVIGLGKMGIPLEGDLQKAGGDIIIDFTNPKTYSTAGICERDRFGYCHWDDRFEPRANGESQGPFEERPVRFLAEHERGSERHVQDRPRSCQGFGSGV